VQSAGKKFVMPLILTIQLVSKNVTNLIFNKVEQISIFFARIIRRIFATNHNYIFLLNLLWTYFTLQRLTVP